LFFFSSSLHLSRYVTDVYLGISTVSCQSSKIRKDKGQLQYFANVALKVNIKLGGINHSIDDANMSWLKKNGLTMILGADVTQYACHLAHRSEG
jgi:eukaryotic translation initiation factor 2C